MRISTVFFVLAVVVAITGVSAQETGQSPAPLRDDLSLCDALERIEPGQQLPVVFSGIYEYHYLYDPKQPICNLNLQPATCVEFATAAGTNKELERLLRESRRAYVTVEGVLHGPTPVPPDNPEEPEIVRYTKHHNDRYCTLHDFRTLLTVNSLVDVKPVPETIPRNALISKNASPPPVPVLQHGALPRYPKTAQLLGISGQVKVAVTIEEGRVADTEVLAGDRSLSEEAVRNIKTWRFDPSVNTTLTTTFVYHLERRIFGTDETTVIEARLPAYVRLTASAYAW